MVWSQKFQSDGEMCLAWKNLVNALLLVITMIDFLVPNRICPDSSNAICNAEDYLAYIVFDICPVVNLFEPMATGANLLVSPVCSSV